MFDKSAAPGVASRWRRTMTADERALAGVTGLRLREATAELEAGRVPPGRGRRSRAKPATPVPSSPDEAAVLWGWVGQHGAAIAPLLAAAGGAAGQLIVASAYRDVVNGKPGAYEHWGRVLRTLDR